jgi:hypothetical protein
MPIFIPGLELSRLFYLEAVKPILDSDFPSLRYAAALTGHGSEVLGFDTEMSTDHCWGPRLMLFLNEDDRDERSGAVNHALRKKLPASFRSFSTNFSPPDPNDNNTRRLSKSYAGEINHGVEFLTIREFFLGYLGFDVNRPIDMTDWLTFPEQKLRALRSGGVFHDEIGLKDTLDKFDYYPHDVWLYVLASGWNRVSQEEHLMGRAGHVGDEIGSALIAARLVRDLMRLCFLMEREYAPYPKWFGTAFATLSCAPELSPVFTEVLASRTWLEREDHLAKAYVYVAAMHNRLEITEPISATVGDFFGRPFKVIHLHGKFADALSSRMEDPCLIRLAEKRLIGSIDQISDNTDILSESTYRGILRQFYREN